MTDIEVIAPEDPQETIVAVLSNQAGTMLAGVLSAWMEDGRAKYAKAHLMGPAGSVVHLTVIAEPVNVAQVGNA